MIRAFVLDATLCVLLVVLITVTYRQSSGSVSLHYSVLNGIDAIGDWRLLFFYPGSILAVALLNLVLVSIRQPPEPFLTGLVAVVTTLVGVGVATAYALLATAQHSILL